MTDLKELLERCKAATGPDRNTDAMLHHFALDGVGTGNWHDSPRYTASVDASLALVERKLPDANCYGVEREPRGWTAYVSRNEVPSGHWLNEATGSTAPLAILCALLQALISQGSP